MFSSSGIIPCLPMLSMLNRFFCSQRLSFLGSSKPMRSAPPPKRSMPPAGAAAYCCLASCSCLAGVFSYSLSNKFPELAAPPPPATGMASIGGCSNFKSPRAAMSNFCSGSWSRRSISGAGAGTGAGGAGAGAGAAYAGGGAEGVFAMGGAAGCLRGASGGIENLPIGAGACLAVSLGFEILEGGARPNDDRP